jgi:hypothetical protein
VRGQGGGDRCQNAIDILHHIMVPETQDAVALTVEKGRPHSITITLDCMLAAIDFHDQTSRVRRKIRKIGSQRNLPAEFGRGELRTKGIPQGALSIRSIPTQCPGMGNGIGFTLHPRSPYERRSG